MTMFNRGPLINERMKGIMEMTKPTYLSFVYVAREVAAVESEGKTVKKTF